MNTFIYFFSFFYFMKKKLFVPLRFFLIFLILLAVLWGGAYFFGFLKKDCHLDKACFDASLSSCKQAEALVVQEGSLYRYEIHGKSAGNCKFEIALEKMAEGTPVNLKDAFEGKSMKCRMPLELLGEPVEKIDSLINYCSGPLKEAIYELIITRLYKNVVGNLGVILSQL